MARFAYLPSSKNSITTDTTQYSSIFLKRISIEKQINMSEI